LNTSCLVALLIIMEMVLWQEALAEQVEKLNVAKGERAELTLDLNGQQIYNEQASNALAKGWTTGMLSIGAGVLGLGLTLKGAWEFGKGISESKTGVEDEEKLNDELYGNPKTGNTKAGAKPLTKEASDMQEELDSGEELDDSALSVAAGDVLPPPRDQAILRAERQGKIDRKREVIKTKENQLEAIRIRNKKIQEKASQNAQTYTAIGGNIKEITGGVSAILSGYFDARQMQLQGQLQGQVTTPLEILKTWIQSASKEASDDSQGVTEVANLMKQLAQERHQAFFQA
jgi:hypothetical protein